MATKKQEEAALTRAQKTSAVKGIIREILAIRPTKHNDLIDEVAKLYVERYEAEGAPNDVKGRIGSVLDIMKKESDVAFDGGTYALKARLPMPPAERAAEETPVKAPKARAKKAKEEAPAQTAEEQPPKKRTRAKKAEVKEEAPVAAVVEAEKSAPKKRTKKTKEEVKEEASVTATPEKAEKPKKTRAKKVEKAEKTAEPVEKTEKKEEAAPAPSLEKTEEIKPPVEEKAEVKPPVEDKAEEKKEEKPLVLPPKAEVTQKGVVMDMSFLFGDKPKAAQKPKREEKPAQNKEVKAEEGKPVAPPAPKKEEPKKEEKKASVIEEKKEVKRTERTQKSTRTRTKTEKPLTADEKLREAFLKKLRALGGDYFEYYSVYLLERYSMKNGRRLETLRISGGDHDGGIDGEIELTDALGFRETIYIQSKNWDPEKGKEENWVVGETLLQQFIGACACRRAKDGKQHTRGIFITTSRFTPDAKKILEDMAEAIVGYDGNDLYETAKECSFGLVKKNGEWSLDERLLSGTKAFFQML